MNPREEKLRALLNDVLPSSADHCGPDQSGVLEMARREQSRRRQIRAALATAAVLAVISSITFFATRPRSASPSPISQSTPVPTPLVIHPINDDELFALLQSTPSAIMEWPNGDRSLLVVTGGDH